MSKEEALAKITCISTEIKELILKRFVHDRKFNPNMDALCASIESAPSCDVSKGSDITVKKGTRKKTERGNFMGYCMRGEKKGGLGKSMSACSDIFKSMPPDEKSKYTEKK